MVKASLFLMALLTVLIGMGLRWRQDRLNPVRAEGRAESRARARRPGLLARGKARLDLWITAAAIASVATILLMGGLHWIRVWLQ
ncbi:hypothetical protein [Teichococcus aestuarii]|uniref:Uncharacterized protein n=1 Tax=Teichococcus aestuarii TaxID=568898 RepID=A0A2U1UYI4_9PROT|nr:hypothetical protein [Pseudoroseomonas aestuarii]PWC26715.1 hypothetical protein CR165_21770 [Pseudoroseomonas aestuarii]